MRIKRLELENFRGFKKASVDFPEGNVAVFFGWNGAGKTAVLDAVAMTLSSIADATFSYGMMPNDDDVSIGQKESRIITQIELLGEKITNRISKFLHKESSTRGGIGDIKYLLHEDWQDDENLPPIAYYKTNRELDTSREGLKNPFEGRIFTTSGTTSQSEISLLNFEGRMFAYLNAINAGINDFFDFMEWFRNEEDIENQQKIEKKDFAWESPRLKTIRRGISAFLSKMHMDFTDLKVQRHPNVELDFSKPSQKSTLFIQKSGQELKLTQLSSGERSLILLVADIARRAAILNPQLDDPLQTEGIVLIDEIELHLHPRWQRAVIPALQATFPNIQFIIATHSPQVLSQVENGSVFEIENFEIHPRDTYGRDNNWLLHVIMEDDERPEEVQTQLEEYFTLIRTGQLDAAAKLRRQIEQKIGTDEPEFAKADVLLHRKERSLTP